MKSYSDLTKFGIVVFVLLSGMAGYITSFPVEVAFSWKHVLCFVLGLYGLSSGSLALNQWQEQELDKKMPRTSKRPICSGKMSSAKGFMIASGLLIMGSVFLFITSITAFLVGLVTVVFYNYFYTKQWKPKMIFAAIPGAIPGALPITIGFAANDPNIFKSDSIYLFLIMFFWQMPHFWALALKYKEDYKLGGVPTLPVALGSEKALYHIGIYSFAFVITAIASPWFVTSSWAYLAVVVPLAIKVLLEYFKYFKANGEKGWFSFFMWVNVSMLIFIFAPIFDKWSFLFISNT
jgi:protoheme IX farnesyltransferase